MKRSKRYIKKQTKSLINKKALAKIKLWNKYVEVERKYKTDTDKMTASDYTHLFGYLNPYYRTAYSIPKRKR